MTIRPGEQWGTQVAAPDGLVTITDDAALADLLERRGSDGSPTPAYLAGGDLRRTLGGPTHSLSGPPAVVNELPIDVIEVRVDGGSTHTACAHVVVSSPWWRGGWLRGPIVLVMNAEFVGDWDVAPRGHPNDGRVEVLEVMPDLTVRQRIEARRRLPAAGHVPHPRITTRSVRSARWEFTRPMVVRIDGRPLGRARIVEVQVIADAAVVYA